MECKVRLLGSRPVEARGRAPPPQVHYRRTHASPEPCQFRWTRAALRTVSDRFSELVSPSASRTVSRTIIRPARLKAKAYRQPLWRPSITLPFADLTTQAQESLPSPVDRRAPSVTRLPTVTLAGALMTAFAGTPGMAPAITWLVTPTE